jgi:polyisoprenoid-binding protein YceI
LSRTLIAPALIVALALAGCGDDPAKDVPKAEVGSPKLPPYPNDPKSAAGKTSPAPAPAPAPKAEPAKDAEKPKEATKTSATTPAPAGAVGLAILPETSKIEFIGSGPMAGAHPGGFKAFSGSAQLADDKPELKSIAVDIDTTSIFSDNPKLTTHLKSKDFFEVEKFPTATFATTEIKAGGDKAGKYTHEIVGNLTLHGVTKSITIPAVIKVDGGSLALNSEFSLNKDDFGMTYGGGQIRPDIVIKLDVKATKKG